MANEIPDGSDSFIKSNGSYVQLQDEPMSNYLARAASEDPLPRRSRFYYCTKNKASAVLEDDLADGESGEDSVKKKACRKKYVTSCPYCIREFNKYKLPRHIKVCHNDGNPYKCGECSFESMSKTDISTHKRLKHVKLYSCEYCPYKTRKTHDLKRHIGAVHTHFKPFQCSQCDFSAVIKGDLNKHIRFKHENEKPYGCPHCEYRAKDNQAIRRHILRVHPDHAGVPNFFICPICDNKFLAKSSLKSHIDVVHNKIRNHHCPYCIYSAGNSYNLKIHIKSVHFKEKPYTCMFCGNRFSMSSNLTTHVQKVHHNKSDKTFVGEPVPPVDYDIGLNI